MTKTERPGLTRSRIVEAAIGIADDEGLQRVTMRRLAGDLGFEAMSLYNHVANKSELLVAMVDEVASNVERPDGPWDEALRTFAISIRRSLEAHPWCVEVWASTIPGPVRLDLMEWSLRRLASSDLSSESAHHAFHAVNNHVIGYVMQGTAIPKDIVDMASFVEEFYETLDPIRYEQMRSHIEQHMEGDTGESFELVLDMILEGIRQRG